MEPLDSQAVANLLDEIGHRMELAGELSFKARAYYNAAENLRAVAVPLNEMVAQGKLRTIPGVGEAIAEKIIKLHKTGTHPTLEHLREQIPAGVLELLKIPGLGPKKAIILHSTLKVANLQDLDAACKSGKVAGCKGLGAAFQAKIAKALAMFQANAGQMLLPVATERLQQAIEGLKQTRPELSRISPAGAARRCCEVVGDLALVAISKKPSSPERLPNEVVVRTVSPDSFGAALLYATGSPEHLLELEKRAREKSLTLKETGLSKGGTLLPAATEEQIYEALGLPYIEPELREGRGEIELAARKALPKLVRGSDIRGVLHSHTNFSDGNQSLEEMAEAVRERGYQYYGVSDHSQTAAYAGGLKAEKIAAQHKLADKLNKKYAGSNFKIFKGIESDILEEGALDYPESVLREFDFIVASVHSRMTLDKETQTARILNAVANPHTTILGHMTGRLLLRRDSYAVDIEAILKACAKYGVVVEINANPHRLDLDWRWHQRALELGCLLSINPDAHDIDELDLMGWGVVMARKGGVPAERVLNCRTLPEIEAFFAERRKRC